MSYEYHSYIDLNKIVNEQARRIRQMVDAATLNRLAPTLNMFGWYKREETADKNGKRLTCERLQTENAKLREALCAAWKCAHAGISCSDCRLIAGGCTLQTAMRELGIEVPK